MPTLERRSNRRRTCRGSGGLGLRNGERGRHIPNKPSPHAPTTVLKLPRQLPSERPSDRTSAHARAQAKRCDNCNGSGPNPTAFKAARPNLWPASSSILSRPTRRTKRRSAMPKRSGYIQGRRRFGAARYQRRRRRRGSPQPARLPDPLGATPGSGGIVRHWFGRADRTWSPSRPASSTAPLRLPAGPECQPA